MHLISKGQNRKNTKINLELRLGSKIKLVENCQNVF